MENWNPSDPPQDLKTRQVQHRCRALFGRLAEHWRDELTEVVSRVAGDAVRETLRTLVLVAVPVGPLREPYHGPTQQALSQPGRSEEMDPSKIQDPKFSAAIEERGSVGASAAMPREPVRARSTSAGMLPRLFAWISGRASFVVALGVGVGITLGVSHQLLALLRLLQTVTLADAA